MPRGISTVEVILTITVRHKMRRDDMVGTEFDWVAADQSGSVAMFSTAGFGPIPDGVLEQRDHHSSIIENVENLAEILSSADLLTNTGPVPVFVYDWTVNSGPYRRTQSPRSAYPVRVDDLPKQLRPFVVLLDLSFGAAETIDACAFGTPGRIG